MQNVIQNVKLNLKIKILLYSDILNFQLHFDFCIFAF
jgi:hypothetical protein